MYLSVWRPFHHTKLHAYTLSSLIKRNVGGGGGGGGGRGWEPFLASLWLCYPRPHYSSVTPGLTSTALLPLASLWLCYPCMASLWLCYPRPHYDSVTPGLTTLPVCVTEILIYCLVEPFSCMYPSVCMTTISPYEAACLHAR